MSSKRALISGITGQDGALLSFYLLKKGYEVFGSSRDAERANIENLETLGIARSVQIFSADLTDFRSVFQILQKTEPDEIYNLAGQSSVGLSFSQPMETFNSITVGTINLLEAVKMFNNKIKIYNAASSECFGDTKGIPASEKTKFQPRSPYAVAKCASYWYVSNYREAYDLPACSGILFNHESPLRSDRFVTQKIINGAVDIKKGKKEFLELGNINIKRDWGWAPDYVKAMHIMLQRDKPEDFVIATGKTHSLEDFVRLSFEALNLDIGSHLKFNESYLRPTDIDVNVGDPGKAESLLGWKSDRSLSYIVENMIRFKLDSSLSWIDEI